MIGFSSERPDPPQPLASNQQAIQLVQQRLWRRATMTSLHHVSDGTAVWCPATNACRCACSATCPHVTTIKGKLRASHRLTLRRLTHARQGAMRQASQLCCSLGKGSTGLHVRVAYLAGHNALEQRGRQDWLCAAIDSGLDATDHLCQLTAREPLRLPCGLVDVLLCDALHPAAVRSSS